MSISRHELHAGPLAKGATFSRLARVKIPPGEPTGRHRHPCDVIGFVVAGTARYEIEGEPAQVLHAGDAFFEPKDVIVAGFDNASDTEPLVFLAHYLLPEADTALIEIC